MIAQGNAEAREAVKQHVSYEANRVQSNDSTDRFSYSAKLAFIEAYETMFNRNQIPYNKTESVWMIDFYDSFSEWFIV